METVPRRLDEARFVCAQVLVLSARDRGEEDEDWILMGQARCLFASYLVRLATVLNRQARVLVLFAEGRVRCDDDVVLEAAEGDRQVEELGLLDRVLGESAGDVGQSAEDRVLSANDRYLQAKARCLSAEDLSLVAHVGIQRFRHVGVPSEGAFTLDTHRVLRIQPS